MDEWAHRFEANRSRLRAMAQRMLGSRAEADDAVQEAWLRLSRVDAREVENFAGWLTTVVARVCLDVLRARKTRGEQPLEDAPEPALDCNEGPEQEAELADGVGIALLVVLETLAPAERVAFVLHDMFDLPFEEIAPIVGRSPIAARQLASRARRRVQGASMTPEADRARQRELVSAFLAASRGGDLVALLEVLDPDVALRADAAAVQASASRPGAPALAPVVHGAAAVADTFKGRAKAARLALIDGAVGAVFAPGGEPRVAFEFAIEDGRIVEMGLVADPLRLRQIELAMLDE